MKSGTIVVEEAMMTLYATSVVAAEQTCLPPAIETPQEAVTEQLPWYRHETDPNVIFIIDSTCGAQFPGQEGCQTLGCPISMYCTSRLNRE